MSKRTRLTSKVFHAINRDLKIPGSQVKAVAKAHGVSEETVRTVKRSKTWPRFEAMKKLKNEQRRPAVTHAPIQAVQVHQGLGEPIRQLDKITRAPENQIRPLPSEEIKVVTVGEWESVTRKLGLLYSRLDDLRKGQKNETSKRWWKRG
jgi:hypothetical protein